MEFSQRNNLFHSRCTIQGKLCSLIIDSRSSKNVIAEKAVQKIGLKEEPHPTPYKLSWLQTNNIFLSHDVRWWFFRLGMLTKMKFYVILLQWMLVVYFLEVLGNWIANFCMMDFSTHNFKHQNRSFTLQPSLPPKLDHSTFPTLLIQGAPFEVTMREEGKVFVLLASPSTISLHNSAPAELTELLRDFADVFPDNLPADLFPLPDLQHRIDFVRDATLTNKPHYRMSPSEHEELQK